MPELPEVEAVVRTLRPLVQGQRIRCVQVFHPIVVKPQPARRLVQLATGRRIESVERKGKYILLMLDRGLLTLHFRLDGQLVWFADGRELLDRANVAENGVHVDVAFELSQGVLGFADRRHFGRVYGWDSLEQNTRLASLGGDALSKDFT
ncbi:MAG TPA: DNA-formamidopyrimidine glycosylase family protein, partial [Candidatus Acidoferrum sp.]